LNKQGRAGGGEKPERLLKLVWEFADSITATPPVAGSFEAR